MRGRRILSVVILLSIVLIGSGVFALGVVDVAKIPVLNSVISGVQPMSPGGESVFVNPSKVVDGSLRPGQKFTVHVNVSTVTNLFTWQVRMSWNKTVLALNKITAGEFLLRTTSANKTAAYQLGFTINSTDNANGVSMFAESILDSSVGATGVSGSGRLASIEFQVVGNGKTVLNITMTETFLIDSAGTTIQPTKTNGWFNNIPGDTNYSGKVDGTDLSAIGLAWLSSPGKITWNPGCDFDNSGKVDGSDLSYLGLYWLKKYW